MEAIKFNDKGYIDLGRARITPDMLINLTELQTNAMHDNRILTSKDYKNETISDYCESLTDLKNFMIEMYATGSFDDRIQFIMNNLVILDQIQRIIMRLKAPITSD